MSSLVSSLQLFSTWRPYWGQWEAYCEPQISPLEKSLCHAPAYALLPDVSHQVIPAGGKIEYNFHLPGGSIIWGFYPPRGAVAVGGGFTSVAIQLTDVNLGHQFFQEPVTVEFLFAQGILDSFYQGFLMLPTPHPVVGDGLFTFEAWGTPGDRFLMILGVAEVTDCPVK